MFSPFLKQCLITNFRVLDSVTETKPILVYFLSDFFLQNPLFKCCYDTRLAYVRFIVESRVLNRWQDNEISSRFYLIQFNTYAKYPDLTFILETRFATRIRFSTAL